MRMEQRLHSAEVAEQEAAQVCFPRLRGVTAPDRIWMLLGRVCLTIVASLIFAAQRMALRAVLLDMSFPFSRFTFNSATLADALPNFTGCR